MTVLSCRVVTIVVAALEGITIVELPIAAVEQVRAGVGHLGTERKLLAIECQSGPILVNNLVFVPARVHQAMNFRPIGIERKFIRYILFATLLHLKVYGTDRRLRLISFFLELIECIIKPTDLVLVGLECYHEISF